MKPRELLGKWVQLFNQADIEALVALYAPDAICHQVVTGPLHGREAIRHMFTVEFGRATMTGTAAQPPPSPCPLPRRGRGVVAQSCQ